MMSIELGGIKAAWTGAEKRGRAAQDSIVVGKDGVGILRHEDLKEQTTLCFTSWHTLL